MLASSWPLVPCQVLTPHSPVGIGFFREGNGELCCTHEFASWALSVHTGVRSAVPQGWGRVA